jgi:sulfhydrogenase subunit beta (sulfur reductase)
METVKISKSDFSSLVANKIGAGTPAVVSVKKKDNHFVFGRLESVDEMCLDYDVTILPASKKYFQPPRETLLKFEPKNPESYIAVNNHEPLILIGLHYYDLAAIYLMDRAFTEGNRDENYIAKRDASVLVGMYPTRYYKYRFANSVVRGDQPYKVADLMLVDMADGNYAVEIVTDKGCELLDKKLTKKSDYTKEAVANAKNRVKDDQKLPIPIELTPEYLTRNHAHPVWKVFADLCYSCGSCVHVCPTCYCFDMKDEVELSLASGERIRVWDGCMLEGFAVCAGGHNFRKDKAARFRHRIFRKGVILPLRYNYWGCVGCGRCAQACTSSIAGPVKVFKYMEDNK